MAASPLRPFILAGIVVAAAGCASLLGIADEVEREKIAANEAGATDASGDVTRPLDADTPDVTDAPVDGDAGPDAAPLCDISKEFGTPEPIASLNTVEDDSAARLSEDELTIYMDGVRSAVRPSFDIFYAERPDIDSPFGAIKHFPSTDNSIDTDDDEYAPNVSANGLVLIFERKNLATSNSDIFTATRVSKTVPFGPVSSVANLNTADYEANVYFRVNPTELWHVRKDPTIDIFLATLTPGVGYVLTKPAAINSPHNDNSPVISKNGLALYLQTSRPIAAGRTDTNIYVATRGTTALPFNTPLPVANVNSAQNDYPGFISGDGCRLYMVSTRPGVGQQDIFVAKRPK